jgi:GT2 family glycosyltransferase
MKVSIIIPTYNHLEDCLKPCVQSIADNTDMSDVQVIVVANGCTDGTESWCDNQTVLGDKLRVLSFDEPLGYPRAVNEGLPLAEGEFVVLANNDLVFTDKSWLDILVKPLESDRSIAMTGPSKFTFDCGETVRESMGFWLVAMRRSLFDTIGVLDEVFSPGCGEDSDFSIRAKLAGYSLLSVPNPNFNHFGDGHRSQDFPVFHKGSATFSEVGKKDGEFYERNKKILEERWGKKTKISFVIPTYNHLEDCLKPCMDSLFATTDFETPDLSIEVFIVANGCVDGTRDYLDKICEERPCVKQQVWTDPKGYTFSTNRGIEAVLPYSDYVILFNNDCIMLPQPKNQLIHSMLTPFMKYKDMGISGPLVLHDRYACHDAVIFFCAMVSKKLFDDIGILHEDYGIGGGEDIDFCVRTVKAGYKQLMVPEGVVMKYDQTNVGPLPIYHKGEGTMDHIPEYGKVIIKKNGFKNMLKYHPDINLNLGSGGVDVPGFHSCDKKDTRAYIILDAEDLSEIPDNRISSILASHLLEHINPHTSVRTLSGWNRVLKPAESLYWNFLTSKFCSVVLPPQIKQRGTT